MARMLDLNADLGESYGPWRMGDDAALLGIVTTANVACGFHAGDPDTMAATFALARDRGVAVGAHPGYDDRAGFGRRIIPMDAQGMERMVAYQLGAAAAIAALAGHRIGHVKTHGALSNLCQTDAGAARAVARAVRAVDPALVLLVMPGTAAEREAREAGLAIALEAYADRAYADDLTLAPRGQPGAVLHDPAAIAERAADMVATGQVATLSGARRPLPFDSLCLHGDGATAVAAARAVRDRLTGMGVTLAPFVRP
ncbi:MAG: LamB/YcsF family protein [Paracoccaceae bacterium]|nr:MAG: LamB/YcsF family protein [Paracoccaceae bacterium]